MNRSNPFRGLLTPGIVVGALIFGGLLVTITILTLNATRPPRSPVGIVTAALTVIPAPTETRVPPTATPGEPTPMPGVPPAPAAGEIEIGGFVEIVGTEGAGLRMRIGPGLDHKPEFLGVEAEIFKVEDGPEGADGYTWWYLVAPLDPERSGWAVSNYLRPVQNP